jgi:hypothetical protein
MTLLTTPVASSLLSRVCYYILLRRKLEKMVYVDREITGTPTNFIPPEIQETVEHNTPFGSLIIYTLILQATQKRADGTHTFIYRVNLHKHQTSPGYLSVEE